MTVSLSRKWRQYLGTLPETGMGYQRVELSLRDGARVVVVVYNAESFEEPEDHPAIRAHDIVGMALSATPEHSTQSEEPYP